jgi:hypothetical protein
MPGLFPAPRTSAADGEQFGLPDNLFIATDSGQADQYLPSSSASQYPRVPGEQYLPDNRAGQYIPAGQAQAVQFRPDVRRLTRVEQLAGGATLIVLISLFLPWFGFAEIGTSISISGTTAHGYLAIAVLVEVLLAGYLLWRSGWEEFPVSLPITHEVLLLIATGTSRKATAAHRHRPAIRPGRRGFPGCAGGGAQPGVRRLPGADRIGRCRRPGRRARAAIAAAARLTGPR